MAPPRHHLIGSTRRRAWSRVAGLLLSAVAAFGHLVGVADLALHQHSTCAEHGELIHVEAGISPAMPSDGSRATWTERASFEAGHEHCVAASVIRARWLQPLDSSHAIAAADVTRVSAPALAPPSQDRASLLLLAPKTSPPA